MPRLDRAARQAETRARLLAAAAAEFSERGYHGASVDAVAERADLTKGAVYSNFATKEDLFLALLDAPPPSRRSTASDDDVVAPDAGDRLWLLLRTELWLHAARHPDVRYKLAARQRVTRHHVGARIESGGGRRAPFAPRDLASVLLALSEGLARQRLLDPESVPEDLYEQVASWLLDPSGRDSP